MNGTWCHMMVPLDGASWLDGEIASLCTRDVVLSLLHAVDTLIKGRNSVAMSFNIDTFTLLSLVV